MEAAGGGGVGTVRQPAGKLALVQYVTGGGGQT
jgi:hypothetical protein